jgi:hypothetical protein
MMAVNNGLEVGSAVAWLNVPPHSAMKEMRSVEYGASSVAVVVLRDLPMARLESHTPAD